MINSRPTSYFQILRRRWWLILLLPLVTVGVILVMSTVTEPSYQSSVRLQIVLSDPQEVPLFSQSRFVAGTEEFAAVQTEFANATQLSSVAWKTIADLGLNLSADELIARIEVLPQSEFLMVTANMPDPQLAQQVVTTHTENALATYRAIRSKSAEITSKFIDSQLALQGETLQAAEGALQKFQLENEVGDLPSEIAAQQDLLRNLRGSRDQAAVEMQRSERLVEQYEDRADALLAQIETADAAQVDSLQRLAEDLRRNAEDQRAIAAGQDAAIAEYDRLLDARQQDLIYLLGLQERYDTLLTDVRRQQETYDLLTSKAAEASIKLRQGQEVGFLQVVDAARTPEEAQPKRTLQLLLVGIVISLLVAVILAFVLEAFENSLGQPSGL